MSSIRKARGVTFNLACASVMINRAKLIIRGGRQPSLYIPSSVGPQIFATRPPYQVKWKYLFFFRYTIVNLTITQAPTISSPCLRYEGGGWGEIEFVSRVIFKAVDYRQLRGESVFKYRPGETTKRKKRVVNACNRRW